MPGTRAKVIQVRIATSVAHDGGTVMAAPAGDNWKVECDSTFWEREQTFKLKHVETKKVRPRMLPCKQRRSLKSLTQEPSTLTMRLH